jgi:SAM-dependent methyltransferase
MKPIPSKKPPKKACWCGNDRLEDFSSQYVRCAQCETLVIRNFPLNDLSQITNEETDLYGANYADRHLHDDYGLPDFATRSREDLTGRCLHWLRSLLHYKLPPADLLELGSFHGGFVGLAKLAGYRARGLDLSPELARQAASMFDVEVLVGPLERQDLPLASLDIIALFDVMEHLQDPRGTLEKCRSVLRADGVISIQTPCYPEGRTFRQMQKEKDQFLSLFVPEHLYLFSKSALKRILSETGFAHCLFEPPVFPQYDMAAFASSKPLVRIDSGVVEMALKLTPGARYTGALLELHSITAKLGDENLALNLALLQHKQDNDDRTTQVAQLTAMVREKEERIAKVDEQLLELNRVCSDQLILKEEALAASAASIAKLSLQVRERDTRLIELDEKTQRQNTELTNAIKSLERNLDARAQQVAQLTEMVQDRDSRLVELEERSQRQNAELATMIRSLEGDSGVRLQQVHALTELLKSCQEDNQSLRRQITELTDRINVIEPESMSRFQQIETLTSLLKATEQDSAARLSQIQTLTAMINHARESGASTAIQRPQQPTAGSVP